MSNESKWSTLIGGLVAAIIPLLVAYGVFTAEQGTLWKAVAEALVALIIAVVVPVTVVSLVKNYNDNETARAVTEMELQQARLRAGLRE